MKNYSIYENLDTSFVNLSALIKYLRQRDFDGNISVRLGEYEAEISINEEHLTVIERDNTTGRSGEGEQALQRLLIRARQPGGIINVYQNSSETASISSENESIARENFTPPLPEQRVSDAQADENFTSNANTENARTEPALPKRETNASEFPFVLSNNVEAKAKQNNLTPEDWQLLLDLTGELLWTIDRTLAEANLNFNTAFKKASSEIAADYPFLLREKGISDYRQGKIVMNEQISAAVFNAGIMEILRRIMEKLGANPKFSEIYRKTVQEVLALIRARKPLYDKFFITAPLEKIIGV